MSLPLPPPEPITVPDPESGLAALRLIGLPLFLTLTILLWASWQPAAAPALPPDPAPLAEADPLPQGPPSPPLAEAPLPDAGTALRLQGRLTQLPALARQASASDLPIERILLEVEPQ